jgi:subtilisin family serine protease
VIDTGVSNNDLNIVSGIDFRDSLGTGIVDPVDYDGHGTHVAGIIGATDDHLGLVGVAPGVRIHNLKVLDDDGTTDVSVVIAAMEYLLEYRQNNAGTPMIVNMSIGENIGSAGYTALDDVVDMAVRLGITVIVAAGNQAVDASLVTPAHVPGAITVGAHDREGYFAAFSNYGPFVDILAPGVDIISLAPQVGGIGTPRRMTGTSMAAPHVTGAAALYLATHPGASPAEVVTKLQTDALAGVALTPPNTSNLALQVSGL